MLILTRVQLYSAVVLGTPTFPHYPIDVFGVDVLSLSRHSDIALMTSITEGSSVIGESQ